MADPETTERLEITERLDSIIALMKLTNRETLEAERENLDEVSKELLDATAAKPVVVGVLKKKVAQKTKQSEKTVQRRISDLVALGVLTKSGGGATAAYRSSGLL
jgi:Fic family protein